MLTVQFFTYRGPDSDHGPLVADPWSTGLRYSNRVLCKFKSLMPKFILLTCTSKSRSEKKYCCTATTPTIQPGTARYTNQHRHIFVYADIERIEKKNDNGHSVYGVKTPKYQLNQKKCFSKTSIAFADLTTGNELNDGN